MDAAIPADRESAVDTKPATFGTASLVFAGVTVLLPVIVMLFFGEKAPREEQAGGWGGLSAIFLVLVGLMFAALVSGLSALAGTITGIVALVRGEQSAWRSVVGLIVNAPIFVLVAFSAIVARVQNGG